MDNLNIKVLVSGGSRIVTNDCAITVKHQRSHAAVVPTGTDRPVGVAYLISPLKTAEDLIAIDTHGASIKENSVQATETITLIKDTTTFKSPYKNLMITHKFADQSGSFTSLPLFWKHDLSAVWDTLNTSTVKILDRNMEEIPTGLWVLDTTDQCIYTSLENSFNEKSGEAVVYFVNYTTTALEVVNILLDVESIYKQRTLDTINFPYTYSAEEGSVYYDITIHSIYPRFAVKPARTARLYLDHPIIPTLGDSWRLRVNNGRIRRLGSNGVPYEYCINEFGYGQSFFPVQPHKRISLTKLKVITPNILYAGVPSLQYTSSLPIDIIVKSRSGILKYAFTTDTTKSIYTEVLERYVKTMQYTQIGDVVNISRKEGFINLGPYKVEMDDVVYATFMYEELYLDIEDMELSPPLTGRLDTTTAVFCIPDRQTNLEPRWEYSVHWFTMDTSTSEIINTDRHFPGTGYLVDGGQEDYTDSQLSYYSYDVLAYLLSHTYAQFIYDFTAGGVQYYFVSDNLEFVETSTSGVFVAELEVPPLVTTLRFSSPAFVTSKGSLPKVVNDGDWFLEIYTNSEGFLRARVYLKELDYIAPESSYASYYFEPANDHQFLLVGEAVLSEATEPHEMQSLDIRVRGGGLKEDSISTVKRKFPQAAWFWDIGNWDGFPVPFMATAIVEFPWYITVNTMGNGDLGPHVELDEADITNAIEYRQALGEYAIRRVWGPRPILIDFSTTDSSITIEFSDEDGGLGVENDSVRYFAYYIEEPIGISWGEWSNPIECDIENKTVTITGLKANTTYLVKILAEASVDDLTWQRGPELDSYKIKTAASES